MLNWHKEEDDYVFKKLKKCKYLSLISRMLMSEKRFNKILESETTKAKLEYREKRLNEDLNIINEERKRINNLVNDMNLKFEEYLKSQKEIISRNINPFKIEAKPYDSVNLNQVPLEIITIYCEPFQIKSIQEKIES